MKLIKLPSSRKTQIAKFPRTSKIERYWALLKRSIKKRFSVAMDTNLFKQKVNKTDLPETSTGMQHRNEALHVFYKLTHFVTEIFQF
jgi:hypothetical protein